MVRKQININSLLQITAAFEGPSVPLMCFLSISNQSHLFSIRGIYHRLTGHLVGINILLEPSSSTWQAIPPVLNNDSVAPSPLIYWLLIYFCFVNYFPQYFHLIYFQHLSRTLISRLKFVQRFSNEPEISDLGPTA